MELAKHKEITIKDGVGMFITVAGDLHLNHATPKSRIDDYASTTIEKLELLRVHMLNRKSNILILLGDVFHKPSQPTKYLNKVIRKFLDFKNSGIEVWAITGNHDITFDRLETVGDSAISTLYDTGIVEPMSKVTIKTKSLTINLVAHHFPTELEPVTDFNAYNIAIAHMFYEFDLSKESLTKEDLHKYGYNMYILGHDHTPYDLETIDTNAGKVRIVRPGSFMRGTSHSYNTKRKVYVDVLEINGDLKVKRDVLPVKNPSEIFTASVMDKVDNKAMVKDLSKRFIDLVTKIYNTSDNNLNVYTIIDDTSIDPKVKERIEMYLNSAGIYRKAVDNSE